MTNPLGLDNKDEKDPTKVVDEAGTGNPPEEDTRGDREIHEETKDVGLEQPEVPSVEGPKPEPSPELKKLESSLKRQSQALDKIATSKADPAVKATAAVMANELRSLQFELSIALSTGQYISDSKLEQIKRKKKAIENQNIESKAVTLVARTAVNSAEQKAQQPQVSDGYTADQTTQETELNEQKFSENLEAIVEKTFSGEAQKSKADALEELKDYVEELPEDKNIAELKIEHIRPELELLIEALQKETILIGDIKIEDLAEALTFTSEPIDDQLLESPEDPAALELLFGDTFINEIKTTAEMMTSNESSSVKARTRQATVFLDKALTQAKADQTITDRDIELIFMRFNLSPELAQLREDRGRQLGSSADELAENFFSNVQAEDGDKLSTMFFRNSGKSEDGKDPVLVSERLRRNYSEAEILKEAYKTVLRERNEKLLELEEARLKGLASDPDIKEEYNQLRTALDNNFDKTGREIHTTDKISRIREFIQKHNKEQEGDEALKMHFLDKIKKEVTEVRDQEGNTDLPELELTGDVEISRDEATGYYVLYFKNKADFDNFTMSDGTAFGAAYRSDRVYLICDDGTHLPTESQFVIEDVGKITRIREVPSLEAIAQHEIAHLAFDDERELQLEIEGVFTAHKILNLLFPKDSIIPNRNVLIASIRTLLSESTTNEKDLRSKILALGSNTGASTEAKIQLLLEYYNRKHSEILSDENDLGRKYMQVEELAAEMSDTLSLPDKRLTLASLGITKAQAESFSIFTTENGVETNKFNLHNVEAINMLRILNQAIPRDTSPEERQKLLEKWAGRIMKFDEFNVTNTLSFIFEIVNQDGINLEDVFPSPVGSSDENSTEGKYLRFSKRYKDGAFRAYVLDQLNRGKLDHKNIQSREQLEELINYAYSIYSNVVHQGLEKWDREDISIPEDTKDRSVGNTLFKFASRPMTDGLINLHQKEGRVRAAPYAQTPRGYNFWAALGLTEKDKFEKGLYGTDASLIPVKLSANLPFGLGENKRVKEALGNNPFFQRILQAIFGTTDFSDESILSDKYRERTGEKFLDMDIQAMHSLMVDQIIARLQESKHYIDPVQIYIMAYERIGLAYSNEGQIIPTYKALTLQKDTYLADHLYVQTNRDGDLVSSTGAVVDANNLPNSEGLGIYQSLVKRGYRGLDLHLLMEAHNRRQRFVDSSGNENSFPEDFPIMLGTVTARTAERTKLMRFNGTANREKKHIEEGQQFDQISRWIMGLQLSSFEEFKKGSIDKCYSLEDVIRAIDEVDNIKPGDPGAKTTEEFKATKKTVTLEFGGQNQTFNRELLKEYVRCFYYGRTYEAMALGVYGEMEVMKLELNNQEGEKEDYFVEIHESYRMQDDDNKQEVIASLQRDLHNLDFTKLKALYDDKQKEEGAFDKLSTEEKRALMHQTRVLALAEYAQKYGLRASLIDRSDFPQGFDIDTLGGTPQKIKIPGKDIYINVPGQPIPKVVKAHDGLTKQEMRREFGDFVYNDDKNHPDSYSLANTEGKLVNGVEDVIFEKSMVSAEYFYFRQLLQQAGNFIGEASAKKERWAGFARFAMLSRWIHTALFVGAAIAFPPALAGFFLNPASLIILLANYFLIGNYLTQQTELWGKRKVSGIQAANKLRELEPMFEEAFFNKNFSLGPQRDRLLNVLKGAEEVLKGMKVISVDRPENVLEGWTRTAAETAREAFDD